MAKENQPSKTPPADDKGGPKKPPARREDLELPDPAAEYFNLISGKVFDGEPDPKRVTEKKPDAEEADRKTTGTTAQGGGAAPVTVNVFGERKPGSRGKRPADPPPDSKRKPDKDDGDDEPDDDGDDDTDSK